MDSYRRVPVNYPGICDTFGKGRALSCAMILPFALHGILSAALHAPGNGWLLSMGCAAASALCGFAGGVWAHEAANERVSEYGFGLTRGGRIVRRAQALAYAAPLALGLAFNAAALAAEPAAAPPPLHESSPYAPAVHP